MAEGTEVIIKDGSVEIEFNEQMFPGHGGKYGNKGRRIGSVEVRDDNTGERHTVKLPENGKCTIRITTR